MRLRLLHAGLLLALTALLLWKVDLGETRGALRSADLGPVAAAVLLNAPIVGLLSYRSSLVLSRLGHSVPLRVIVPSAILGNVAGTLTPGAVGEALRAAALRSASGVAMRDGVAMVVFERGWSVYLLALATGMAAVFAALPLLWAVAVLFLAAAMLAAPPISLRLGGRLAERVAASRGGRLGDAARQASDIIDRVRFIMTDWRVCSVWAAATVCVFALNAVQLWLVADAVTDAPSIAKVWVAFGASQMAGIASMLPLGLGTSDAALAATLGRSGLTLEQGTAVAVLARAAGTIPLGLSAIASYALLARQARRRTR